jgi:hypothetical protein
LAIPFELPIGIMDIFGDDDDESDRYINERKSKSLLLKERPRLADVICFHSGSFSISHILESNISKKSTFCFMDI